VGGSAVQSLRGQRDPFRPSSGPPRGGRELASSSRRVPSFKPDPSGTSPGPASDQRTAAANAGVRVSPRVRPGSTHQSQWRPLHTPCEGLFFCSDFRVHNGGSTISPIRGVAEDAGGYGGKPPGGLPASPAPLGPPDGEERAGPHGKPRRFGRQDLTRGRNCFTRPFEDIGKRRLLGQEGSATSHGIVEKDFSAASGRSRAASSSGVLPSERRSVGPGEVRGRALA